MSWLFTEHKVAILCSQQPAMGDFLTYLQIVNCSNFWDTTVTVNRDISEKHIASIFRSRALLHGLSGLHFEPRDEDDMFLQTVG
jgi:hypothetical protein